MQSLRIHHFLVRFRRFTQRVAESWAERAESGWFIFACGRYEGIDSRVMQWARGVMELEEVTIGDYVLPGGESAVLIMIEAVSRLLPGVLGNGEYFVDDSFSNDEDGTLLEGPVYTKPPEWRGLVVPEILLSGHHANIKKWRRDQAEVRTQTMRPDLRP